MIPKTMLTLAYLIINLVWFASSQKETLDLHPSFHPCITKSLQNFLYFSSFVFSKTFLSTPKNKTNIISSNKFLAFFIELPNCLIFLLRIYHDFSRHFRRSIWIVWAMFDKNMSYSSSRTRRLLLCRTCMANEGFFLS